MAKQSIPQASYPVNNVRNLPPQVKGDAPNVQATFDKGTEDGRTYINGTLIPALNGNTGANMIGLSNVNLSSDNVGDGIDELYSVIQSTVVGGLPNDSVTNLKLNPDVKVGSLSELSTTDKTSVTNAINELEGEIDTLQTDLGNLSTTVSSSATNLEILRKFNPTTGSSVSLAVDTFGTFDLTKNGNILNIIPNVTNTGAMTINPDVQGTKSIKKFNIDTDAYVDLEAGDIRKNTPTSLAWILASDFFVLAPKSGATIKSIQRGNTTFSSADTIKNITINAVDQNKCGTRYYLYANSLEARDICFTTELTSNTNLQIRREVADPSLAEIVYWEVIEFNNVKSIQKGSVTINSGQQNVTVSNFNINKSIVFGSLRTTQTGLFPPINNNFRIIDSTTLRCSGNSAGTAYYQLIEFY